MSSETTKTTFFARLGTLPGAATAFVGAVAAFITLVAFNNITDYQSNFNFVTHVMSMDSTFEGNNLMYRAITAEWFHHAAYIFLISLECVAAIFLLIGFFSLLSSVLFGKGSPASGRRNATIGLVVMVIVFGIGFAAIGAEWFLMWQSPTWNGQPAADRVITMVGFALLLLHLPSKGWGDTEK